MVSLYLQLEWMRQVLFFPEFILCQSIYMPSWFLLDLSHVLQHFSGGWRWNPGEQPPWNLELCREGLFICWIWVVIPLQMQSPQSVWAFIQHCPSLNIYLHVYPIFFFFLFGYLPFLMRICFPPLSVCIFPSSVFVFFFLFFLFPPNSVLFWTNEPFSCLWWIFLTSFFLR